MTDELKIAEYMKKVASIKGVDCSKTLINIAKAKSHFLGEDWVRCPCDADNPGRFCISTQCRSEIEKNGTCHCGAFLRSVKKV